MSALTLVGVLSSKKFHDKDSGWLVGKLDTADTVVGEMLNPQIGCRYTFTGEWTTHSTFGRQFKFSDFEAELPTTKGAIAQYLSENLIGVGPVTATALVDRYGEHTLAMMREEPLLVSVETGLSEEKTEKWAEALQRIESTEKMQVALRELFGTVPGARRIINSVIRTYGSNALDAIKQNPYQLIKDIRGVGWDTADKIGLEVGIAVNSPDRILAASRHLLLTAAQGDGHTCLPGMELLEKVIDLVALDVQVVVPVLQDAMNSSELVLDPSDLRRVALPHLHDHERFISERIGQLVSQDEKANAEDVEVDTTGLAEDQTAALKSVLTTRVFALTGGPGTGKTFLIKRIISSYLGKRVVLCAPTGRAAKRIEEQTGYRAATIHRLLEYKVQGNGMVFMRNERSPLRADVLVVDECSMVDVWLMDSLLRAVDPRRTRLILVGDIHQLPSIGPGNVLGDVLRSNRVPSAELTEIKRQDADCTIPTHCASIRNGDATGLTQRRTEGDYFFVAAGSEDLVMERVLEIVQQRLPQKYGFDSLNDVMVINPRRTKVKLSCEQMNPLLQDALNTNGVGFENYPFKIGDRVVQTVNDYSHEVMNGDIGRVKEINPNDKILVVQFEAPEREVVIGWKQHSMDLAYALTVHKCQGSEFPAIVVPIHPSMGAAVLQRNLLYTAISRAQKLCIVVGDPGEVSRTVRRNSQANRHSRLAEFLEATAATVEGVTE